VLGFSKNIKRAKLLIIKRILEAAVNTTTAVAVVRLIRAKVANGESCVKQKNAGRRGQERERKSGQSFRK
jgi:hypothetical protein